MTFLNYFDKKIIQSKSKAIIFVLFIHFIFRAYLLVMNAFPFNADEAIVALMGKHILSGERPIFFYGQSYMGSLDAYLLSFVYRIFGINVLSIRILQIILYALTIVFIYYFVIVAFENMRSAFYTSILLAVPTVNIVLYTTVSLGGYGEALAIGSATLLLSAWLTKNAERIFFKISFVDSLWFFIFGFLIGLGFWANALSLVLTVPAGLLLLFKILKMDKERLKILLTILLIAIGFFIGSSLWWYELFYSSGIKVVEEVLGRSVSLGIFNYAQRTFFNVINFLLFGISVLFGIRPPWDIEWILLPVIPFILFYWILVIKNLIRTKKSKKEKKYINVLWLIILLFFAAYIFTSRGMDPSGRYFLPLIIPLSIFAGYMISINKEKIILFLFLFILCYQLFGSVRYVYKYPFFTTQFTYASRIDQRYLNELIMFLGKNNEFTGYSNYWISYPLAFLSKEKIISTPILPYRQTQSENNRIPEYSQVVAGSENVFYITAKYPYLDKILEERFSEKNIIYKYIEIGDYHVYYHLNKKITPEELGIYQIYE